MRSAEIMQYYFLLCAMITSIHCEKPQFQKDDDVLLKLRYERPQEFRLTERDTSAKEQQFEKRRQDDEIKIERLHIRDRKTGFDGSVKSINVGLPEDVGGVRAYGLPIRNPQNNGFIENIELKNNEFDYRSRNGRMLEAYGMNKKRLENNGFIERVPLIADVEKTNPFSSQVNKRVRRSDDPEKTKKKKKKKIEDLEAQEAKVFRPLFVYRKQMAKRLKHKEELPYYYGRQPRLRYSRDHRYPVYR